MKQKSALFCAIFSLYLFSLEKSLALRFHYCIFALFSASSVTTCMFFLFIFPFKYLFRSFLLPWITNHLKHFCICKKTWTSEMFLANKICANPFWIIILQHSLIQFIQFNRIRAQNQFHIFIFSLFLSSSAVLIFPWSAFGWHCPCTLAVALSFYIF